MLEWLSALEGSFLLWIQECLRCPLVDPFVEVYTQLGNSGLLWIALSLLMLCSKRTRKAGAVALLAMFCGLLCTNILLKHLFMRPRPWLTVEGLTYLVVEKDPNSFPSGHTCAAFAAAGAWARFLPKKRKWMGAAGLVLAALMGLSRLYVGVHFPSDVLCGMLVGLFCAWAAGRYWRQLERKRGWRL